MRQRFWSPILETVASSPIPGLLWPGPRTCRLGWHCIFPLKICVKATPTKDVLVLNSFGFRRYTESCEEHWHKFTAEAIISVTIDDDTQAVIPGVSDPILYFRLTSLWRNSQADNVELSLKP